MIGFAGPADTARWVGLMAGIIGLLLCYLVYDADSRRRQEKDSDSRRNVPRPLIGFTAASFLVSIVGQVVS